MGIEKPMKEIAAGVEVASTFPGPISQEPARSVPSPSDDLINTPTPLIYFQNLADNFRTALETRIYRFAKPRRTPEGAPGPSQLGTGEEARFDPPTQNELWIVRPKENSDRKSTRL